MTGGGDIAMRGRRLLVAFAVALASAACGGGGGGNGGEGTGAAPLGPSLPAQSSMAVTVRTETFVDASRPTPAEGDAPPRASRTLVTTMARPDQAGPFPLVLFSHGFGGSGEDSVGLLRAIASAGYVVAAPDYPLTSKNAPGGPQRGTPDMAEQPADASFVINEVLRLSGDPGGPLSGSVDAARIGAAGHSMGAGVTMGLAYNECCQDRRVKAAVILAGSVPSVYRGVYFRPPSPPILVVHGEADESLPYLGGRRVFLDAGVPKFFLTIVGGNHNAPYSPGGRGADVVMAATVDFLDTYLKGRPDGITRLEAHTDKPGVAKLESEIR
ncbi:MAG TPA: hypothetical protein VHF00_07790 [Acidimicrobiales bacterium]|nr:hypothetical protein [Acidimicrobiales bacterium]